MQKGLKQEKGLNFNWMVYETSLILEKGVDGAEFSYFLAGHTDNWGGTQVDNTEWTWNVADACRIEERFCGCKGREYDFCLYCRCNRFVI